MSSAIFSKLSKVSGTLGNPKLVNGFIGWGVRIGEMKMVVYNVEHDLREHGSGF